MFRVSVSQQCRDQAVLFGVQEHLERHIETAHGARNFVDLGGPGGRDLYHPYAVKRVGGGFLRLIQHLTDEDEVRFVRFIRFQDPDWGQFKHRDERREAIAYAGVGANFKPVVFGDGAEHLQLERASGPELDFLQSHGSQSSIVEVEVFEHDGWSESMDDVRDAGYVGPLLEQLWPALESHAKESTEKRIQDLWEFRGFRGMDGQDTTVVRVVFAHWPIDRGDLHPRGSAFLLYKALVERPMGHGERAAKDARAAAQARRDDATEQVMNELEALRRLCGGLSIKSEKDLDALNQISSDSYQLEYMLSEEWASKAKSGLQSRETGIVFSSQLSFEEREILRALVEDRGPFPAFVNGRPGTGKSTILHYVFSDLHRRYRNIRRSQREDPGDHEDFGPPIYLTYSRTLRDLAVKSVLKIDAYHCTLHGWPAADPSRDEAELRASFWQFQEFLLNQLSAPELESKFRRRNADGSPRDDYVDFPRFSRMFNAAIKDQNLRRIGAETAWHVIRTYIKGMPSETEDRWFGIEEFDELPRRLRTISSEDFRAIYNGVWSNWYRDLCYSRGYWDDQDLVAHALESFLSRPTGHHVAIVCDEAQDFTARELALLLQISLFTHRDLGYLGTWASRNVPFLFAGDPFQTLNPTGFDWESISSLVFGHFQRSFGQAVGMRHHELETNYRATPSLAAFCNTLLLLRGKLTAQTLSPQRFWRTREPGSPPSLVSIEETWVRDWLQDDNRENLKVLLLPCGEGEKREYIERDEVLALIPEGAATFLTTSEAKGAEWRRVVLYKFGEELKDKPGLAKRLKALVDGTRGGAEPAGEPLPIGDLHQLNRLYVAASRAREGLLIVDTPAAIDNFWQHIRPDRIGGGAHARRFPAESLGGWTIAREVSVINQGMRPDELGCTLLAAGQAQRNVDLLEQARALFSASAREYHLCTALLCELAEKPDLYAAADAYRKSGQIREALRCYWSARRFRDYRDLAAECPEGADKEKMLAAELLAKTPETLSSAELLGTLHSLQRALAEDISLRPRVRLDPVWDHVVNELCSRAHARVVVGGEISFEEAADALARLIQTAELDVRQLELARLYAKAVEGSAEPAKWVTRALNSMPPIDPPQRWAIGDWVVQLDARDEFPRCVGALHRLERFAEIAERYSEQLGVPLSSADSEDVFASLLEQKRFDLALELIHNRMQTAGDKRSIRIVSLLKTGIDRSFGVRVVVRELLHFLTGGTFESALTLWHDDTLYGQDLVALGLRSERSAKRFDDIDAEFLQFVAFSDAFGRFRKSNHVTRRLEELTEDSEFRRAFRGRFSPLVIGAVFEREGTRTAARRFYEQIFVEGKWIVDDEMIERAAIRWIKLKQKEADVPVSISLESPVIDRHVRRAFELLRDARQRFTRWWEAARSSLDYPSREDCGISFAPPSGSLRSAETLGETAEADLSEASPSTDVTVNDRSVVVKWLPSRRKLRLTHGDDIVEALVDERRLDSRDVEISAEGQDLAIKDWGLRIRFDPAGPRVQFSDGERVVLSVRCA